MRSIPALSHFVRMLSSVRRRFLNRQPRRRPEDPGKNGPCGASLSILAVTLLVAAAADATEVTFKYRPSGGAATVNVAGSFNGWNTGADAMTDPDGDGLFEAKLDLPPGKHQYKFVVNGTNWITDETAQEFADDGFGGKNSVVTVGDAPMVAGVAGDAPAAPTVVARTDTAPAAGSGDGNVTFRFRPSGAASSVTVAGSFNGWDMSKTPLKDADQDGLWEGTTTLAPGKYEYKFVVNGSEWITDETAPEFADDGFGGKNSVMQVGSEPLVVGVAGGAGAGTAPPSPTGGTRTQVTFRYQPVIGGVGSVTVAGTFNNWDALAEPLGDADQDGIWEVDVQLVPGTYEYKFVVDGDQWFSDDFAMDYKDDGLGGENSVIVVADKPLITGPGGNVSRQDTAPEGKLRSVIFRHKPSAKPDEIVLAGTFNDWKVGATPMADPDGDGEYAATMLLADGDYQYKFVIDGNWTTDRVHADGYIDDGFGGENSVISVDGRFQELAVALGDDQVVEVGLSHNQTSTEVNNMGTRVEISMKSHKNDVDGVDLLVREGGSERTIPLKDARSDGAYTYWSAQFDIATDFSYLGVYRDGSAVRHLSPGGFSEEKPSTWYEFSATAFPPFRTPEWMKDAVIYQIFPDRFRNENNANDPDFSEWYYEGKNRLPESGKTNGEYYHLTTDWYDVAGLTVSPYRTDGKPDYFSFYGGDVAGVRAGLSYLEDLGVTAIYFNPLFQAKSNHKYDCADYMKIDPHFGTNHEFKALVDDAHSRGIRIILDIVYNHCGNGHWAFADAVKKGTESEYYNWFEFSRWPLPASFGPGTQPKNYYACWWGFGDLPDLNFDLSRAAAQEIPIRDKNEAQPNQPLIAHLKEVTEYWIGDMDCDGVRLDVANEVPFWFWTDFNNWVKTVKPEAYVVGEIWGDASDWVSPTMFDATMNYAFFRDPVTKFLGQGRGTAREFDSKLASGRNTYPTQSSQVMMNLLGSHDTVRYRQQVNGSLDRMKLSYLFGMTYVGAPHIYYGDEIGMMGGKDPDCRRPFRWNWQEDEERVNLHAYVRGLAKARAEHASLRRGDFTTVLARGHMFAYVRSYGDEKILVALNAGGAPGKATLDLSAFGNPSGGTDLLTGKAVSLNGEVSLSASSGIAVKLN